MNKVSVLVLVALVAVSGCGRRRLPVTAVATDSPPGIGRQSVTRLSNGQCVLNREVMVRGPVLNGQQTYEPAIVQGNPYPC